MNIHKNIPHSKINLSKNMRKFVLLMTLFSIFALAVPSKVYAQEQEEFQQEQPAEVETRETTPATTDVDPDRGGHQVIKDQFIAGGDFMWPVLICFIIGLAVAIERVIVLNLKTINSNRLLNDVEAAIQRGGVDAAKNVTRDTRGPIASVFYQALDRSHEGLDIVEKSIISYGSVQMGRLEKGLIWISLFIAIAPMLGFMGTVIGMIAAFDNIEAAGDISPAIVAGGIKIALLTTVAGLIVAVILQVFYNYLVSKVDALVNDMEDASISLVDILIKHNIVKGV
jgi:biopolymer transport protein ExbB